MPNWKAVTEAAPEIAKLVQRRFEDTGLGYLATIRRDGFPRISGIEPLFQGDELWMGMMTNSRKGADLERDPRFSLHNASVDKDVKDGDVKVAGCALLVDDTPTRDAFRADVKEIAGHDPGGDFSLFRSDVTEIATVRPGGDVLIIDWWREGGEPQHLERK
ncbi:MAG: pyridoxamine 5'-phosphate oxidase family protein [Actinomycetota bacterium]|nr:pyridoxamine 5'-phosphate oxidase family protein [Actinomycetota bacterium]